MVDPDTLALVRQKYKRLSPVMNEKVQRQWAAAEALGLAHGGIALVAQATGLSRTTIAAGIRELQGGQQGATPETSGTERVRRRGGGRKSVVQHDPAVLEALEALVEPTTRVKGTGSCKVVRQQTRHFCGIRVRRAVVSSLPVRPT